MSVALLLHSLTGLVAGLDDTTPAPEDVKAGWTAFAIFLLLIGAVVVLGFSLVKQLRKAQAAKDAGVYDDDTDHTDGTARTGSAPENHSAS
jgi:hypothetical protein